MATQIQFSKNPNNGRFVYQYESDGLPVLFQVETAQAFDSKPSSIIDVLAKIADNLQYTIVGVVDVYANNNNIFKIEMPQGVKVSVESHIEIVNAYKSIIED